MSWQLASFAGAWRCVLARRVRLVRALPPAARGWSRWSRRWRRSAVAGRLVLAPIPNVVATTDIVLITGYALGAAPGFAVGALAAPVSNIWLGQGPWTPWQMAGWGLVGLGGAWLAVRHRPAARPLGLAVACALAGLRLRGAARPLGDGHLRRRAVARPLPGALGARDPVQRRPRGRQLRLIALAAGPALVRMISRFRDRLEFTWRARRRACRSPLAALALVAALASAPRRRRGERQRRCGAVPAGSTRAQNADGGFGADPGLALEPGDDRLGDARARGGRPQPARRRARRRDAGRLPARQVGATALDRRPRADDPRARPAPGSTRALRRRRPGRRAALAPRPRRLVRRPGQPDRLRDPRPARRRGRAGGARAAAALAAARPRTATAAGASSPRRASEPDRPARRCRRWPPPAAAAARASTASR